ncbi:MAG: hypothetical protein DI534_07620 [Leifsonia xyli]|nr:MAG: hypothetical protein DI534_07620 [Leifsonia xyli]
MPAAAPLPADIPHPAFAVRDAIALGIDRNRMRRGDLTVPFRGVREFEPSRDLLTRCGSCLTVMRTDAYLCGPTAALLWGLPLPRRLEDDPRLHVGLPHGERATRLTGTVGHHFVITPAELTVLNGIPVTTPARTWCDLAPYLTLEDLVAAGDRVIWRRDPLATLAELYEMAERHPGRRGGLTRLAALPLLSERSDGRPESQLRLRFAAAGLPPVSPNLEVYDRYGRLIAEIDLAFEKYRVGVDHEGDHHRTSARQWRRDLRRFVVLEDDSWSMIRSTADDLNDMPRLLDTVERRLRARGWVGGV